jgi:hypothetical protein
MDRARVLVVANRTAESPELLHTLEERAAEGPITVTLVVPATPHGLAWATDMHSGGEEAGAHLERALARMRAAALEVADGRLGDPDPLAAVEDAVNLEEFDEIVVSTLPGGISRWLKLDLPSRVARATGLPVRHVIASEARAPAAH